MCVVRTRLMHLRNLISFMSVLYFCLDLLKREDIDSKELKGLKILRILS